MNYANEYLPNDAVFAYLAIITLRENITFEPCFDALTTLPTYSFILITPGGIMCSRLSALKVGRIECGLEDGPSGGGRSCARDTHQ